MKEKEEKQEHHDEQEEHAHLLTQHAQ